MAGPTVTLSLIQCHDDESVFAVARALNWQTSCVSSPSIIRHVLYRLYVNWRFLHGIEAQFLALQKGFNEVIPQHLLKSFDEKELEVRDKTVFQNKKNPCVSFLFDRKSKYNKIQMNSPSLLSAHSVWPGKDWHLWLEVQHPSEALHPWQQHCQMVLESRGVVWRGEEGQATAICYWLIQSPTARLQGFTGYLSDLVCVIPLSLLRSCSTSGLAYFPPPFTAHHYL